MPSKIKELIPTKDYELFQRYYQQFGIGEEASFLRSGTEISTLISLVSGFGGKPINKTPEDIYSQLKQVGSLGISGISKELRAEMEDAGLIEASIII